MSIKRQSNGSENSSTSGWAVPCAIVRDSPLLEPVYSKQRNGFDFDWIALEKGHHQSFLQHINRMKMSRAIKG